MLGGPFLGAEAVRSGLVRKHELRTSSYVALFPGVYLAARGGEPTFAHRVEAAWLWSRRREVIAGLTASRMYGAKWIDDAVPVELLCANARVPDGIITSAVKLVASETAKLGPLPVTSLARTAFDLARRPPLGVALARLDALGAAARSDCEEVLAMSRRHRGVRGVRQIAAALALHDAGAQSPKETWLRLLIIDAGFPQPRTQIPVKTAGGKTYYLDMGWEDLKVAAEYDGDHHRTDRTQFARDITRLEELAGLGWIVIRVAAGTPPREIVRRIDSALRSRNRPKT